MASIFSFALSELAANFKAEVAERLAGPPDEGGSRPDPREIVAAQTEVEEAKNQLAMAQQKLRKLGGDELTSSFVDRVARGYQNILGTFDDAAADDEHPLTRLRSDLVKEKANYLTALKEYAKSTETVAEAEEAYKRRSKQLDSLDGRSTAEARIMLATEFRDDNTLNKGDRSVAAVLEQLLDTTVNVDMAAMLAPLSNWVKETQRTLTKEQEKSKQLFTHMNARKRKALNTARMLDRLERRDANAWQRIWLESFDVPHRPTVSLQPVFLAQLFKHYAGDGVGEALTEEEYARLEEKVMGMRITAIAYGEEVIMNLESYESPERKTLNAICEAMAIVTENAKAGIVAGGSAIGISDAVAPKLGADRTRRRYRVDENEAYGFTDADYRVAVAANLSTTMNALASNELGTNLHKDGVDLIVANKVSRCGLDPRLWFKECKVATSGVVDRALQMWAENGYHALTAEELRAAYDPGYRYLTASVDYQSLYHLDDGSRLGRGSRDDDEPPDGTDDLEYS